MLAFLLFFTFLLIPSQKFCSPFSATRIHSARVVDTSMVNFSDSPSTPTGPKRKSLAESFETSPEGYLLDRNRRKANDVDLVGRKRFREKFGLEFDQLVVTDRESSFDIYCILGDKGSGRVFGVYRTVYRSDEFVMIRDWGCIAEHLHSPS
jgi:hypothetical protein